MRARRGQSTAVILNISIHIRWLRTLLRAIICGGVAASKENCSMAIYSQASAQTKETIQRQVETLWHSLFNLGTVCWVPCCLVLPCNFRGVWFWIEKNQGDVRKGKIKWSPPTYRLVQSPCHNCNRFFKANIRLLRHLCIYTAPTLVIRSQSSAYAQEER